jgi:crossover junction endodeoxyribonuclease RuvC
MSAVIGIDPGLSGAIAWLGPNGGAHVVDMPTIQLSKTGFVKRALDVNGLTILLDGYAAASCKASVFLERVNAFPGQGVASMFSLGMSFWGAAGVVSALKMPLHLVEPKDWKGHFRLNADKELARGLASRYYPSVNLTRKKDHGRAEALLIARYGQETAK